MRDRVAISKRSGYTNGMKTAISIADAVFREAERFARRSGKSRSQLYTEAVREYLERHAPDAITESMNRAWDVLGSSELSFTAAASGAMLERESW